MICPYCKYGVTDLEKHLKDFGDPTHALHWALHHRYFEEQEVE